MCSFWGHGGLVELRAVEKSWVFMGSLGLGV